MGVNYSEIIEKMRWAGKLKNDSAVARRLGVTPQALSNYKKRGEMPTDLVLKFSKMYDLSMDWLITGEGAVQKPGTDGKGLISYPMAGEETTPYAETSASVEREPGFGSLDPDEIIYVGKLLKILRGENNSNKSAIRFTIDAFLKNPAGQSSNP
jgi:hypothetical protein